MSGADLGGSAAPSAAARRRRENAAAKSRPDHVRLLLVAEAPPSDVDRYFYFDDVGEHDSMFRHVVHGAGRKQVS